MWVVNPSEEEEKRLINRWDTVPGAHLGANWPWKHGSQVLPPQRNCADLVWTHYPNGWGNEGVRGAHQHSLEELFLPILGEGSRGCDLYSSLQVTACFDPSASGPVALILSCPSTPLSLPHTGQMRSAIDAGYLLLCSSGSDEPLAV